MKNLLIEIGKKSKIAFSSQINLRKKNKILKDYCLLIKKNRKLIIRENQKDSDTLPPYEILDPILEAFIEEDLSVEEIVDLGFDRTTVIRVLEMVKRNEYKRRQTPPGVRISNRAFGRDWRYPITSGYNFPK